MFREIFSRLLLQKLSDGQPLLDSGTRRMLAKRVQDLEGKLVSSNLRLIIARFAAISKSRNGKYIKDADLVPGIRQGEARALQLVRVFDVREGFKFSTLAQKSLNNDFRKYFKREDRKEMLPLIEAQYFDISKMEAPQTENLELDDEAKKLYQAIGTLEPIDQFIIASRFEIAGTPKFTFEQIGKFLGFEPQAGHIRMKRALERIKKLLDN